MNAQNCWKLYRNFAIACVIAILTVGSQTITHGAQQHKDVLPTVTVATVPTYPSLPREARLQGTVQLWVTTDGSRVSRVKVESGAPLLAQAAQENLKTWQLKPHAPTSFRVTFHYVITNESDCGPSNGIITLHLPTELEISVVGFRECRPEVDSNAPFQVNLLIKHNGKAVSLPAQVTLTWGGHMLQVPLQNGHFVVPAEVTRATSVDFLVTAGKDQMKIEDIHGSKFSFEYWTLIIEDHQFKGYEYIVPKDANTQSTCVLRFDSKTSEGVLMANPHCRGSVK